MRYGNISFGPGTGISPAVKWLMLANGGVFFAQYFLLPLIGPDYLLNLSIQLFGLVPYWITHKFFLWQFFTYMFLHGGVFHILFNMFALWMFGTEIERYWGTGEFVKYYFLCGVGAGLITFISSLSSVTATIGASGAIFGVLVAYAMMFPDRYVYVYFFFPVKVKYLVAFFAVVEFFASLGHTPDGVGHFAHLGGMLIGYIYLKFDWRISGFFRKLQQMGFQRQERARERKEEAKRRLLEDVDRILDKINREGMESLTKEEKKRLDQASHHLSENKESRK